MDVLIRQILSKVPRYILWIFCGQTINYCAKLKDMKLLDFTGRKVDPSLIMGTSKDKKEQDPNIKVEH